MSYNADLQSHNKELRNILAAVNDLPDAGSTSEGVELPELTNPATAAEIGAGYEVIDQSGQKLVGTAPVRDGGDLTIYGNKVTVPKGLYKSNESAAVAAGTLDMPIITVDAATGTITAYSQVTAPGYLPVTSRKSMALQNTQAGKTVTPTTTEQTVVSAGTFVTGDIKVAAVTGGGSGAADMVETELAITDHAYMVSYAFFSTNDCLGFTEVSNGDTKTVTTFIGGDVAVIVDDYWESAPVEFDGLEFKGLEVCNITGGWGNTILKFRVTSEYPSIDITFMETTG